MEGTEIDAQLYGLWRTVLDHTSCPRSTAHILEEITRARRSGKIDYCLVFRRDAESANAGLDSTEWSIRVVHTSS
jgi:hypothetical protein